MVTRIQKWGNSQGLRIPREILEEAHVSVNDEVDVSTENGIIIITPVKRVRRGRNLEELLAGIPDDYRAEETDWGVPQGKETW